MYLIAYEAVCFEMQIDICISKCLNTAVLNIDFFWSYLSVKSGLYVNLWMFLFYIDFDAVCV